jgi:hypothetical protein
VVQLVSDTGVLDRLCQIRDRMQELDEENPGYEHKAVKFALESKPTDVNSFCSSLELFEEEYAKETDEEEDLEDDYETIAVK